MWTYGGNLYVSSTAGLEVWHPLDGTRIGLLGTFRPIAHSVADGRFAEVADGRLRTWTPAGNK